MKKLLPFIAIPIVVAFLISWTAPYSVWGTRHLIVTFPAVFIAVGAAVGELPAKWLRNGGVGLCIALTLAGGLIFIRRQDEQYTWCGCEAAGAQAAASAAEARIYTFEDLVAYHVWFGARNSGKEAVYRIAGIEGLKDDPAYFLPRGFDAVKIVSIEEVSDDSIDVVLRSRDLEPSSEPLRSLIARGYYLTDARAYFATDGNTYLVKLAKIGT